MMVRLKDPTGMTTSRCNFGNSHRVKVLEERLRCVAIELLSHELRTDAEHAEISAQLRVRGETWTLRGIGNGPIDAFVNALSEGVGISVDVVDYSEHTLGLGSGASAVAYVETIGPDGKTRWGVGIHPSILSASLRAVVSAVNGRDRAAGRAMPI